jgi:hypothetical protein
MLSGNPQALPWQQDMETTFATAKGALVAAVPLAHPLRGPFSLWPQTPILEQSYINR